MKQKRPEGQPLCALEQEIGYTFLDITLCRRALTHPTYTNELGDPSLLHYEQLEFLGDSVLSFLVRDFLFSQYPTTPEGILSSAHSTVVKRDALQQYASRIQLGDYLFLGRGAQTLRHSAKVLEDTFEALVAALYLDGGIEVARKFVLSFVRDDLLRIVPQMKATGSAVDCKTRLQQFIQEDRESHHTLRYEQLERTGPDHAPSFRIAVLLDDTVICEGCGTSIKKAEEEAARHALQYFRLEPQDK